VSVASRKIRLLMELRRSGVTDTRVLSAIEVVPREAFVAEPFLDKAYENSALPIECGQTISQPLVVGIMSQALEIGDRMKVLEVGTGSGYQAAVLAKLCRRVYTIERHRTLATVAEKRFADLRIHNITAKLGDGYKGWPEQAPFDRILVTAAARELPITLLEQLADDGIMVIPVGDNPFDQQVMVIHRQGENFTTQSILPVRFVPLVEGMPNESDA
jgi:protein-L-isoaspartate(D-aspartate) O-methyltransferase